MTFRHVRHGIALILVLPVWLTTASASAQNRTDRPGGDAGTTAVARPSSPAPAPAPASAPPAAAPGSTSTPAGRGERTGPDAGGGNTTPAGGDAGSGRRPDRGGDPVVGRAEPRPAPARPKGGGAVTLVPDGYGFYPLGYGGLGFGGY